MTIRNPIEWGYDQVRLAVIAVGTAGDALGDRTDAARAAPLAVRRIGFSDLKDALARGFDDFKAYRTDVVFLCLIYPVIGLVLARHAFGDGMLTMLFPLASGFALIGPFAAIGLYEMSRRREQNADVAWPDAFSVVRAPAFGKIAVLGMLLVAMFFLWLAAANVIYTFTMGPEQPASLVAFVGDLFTTPAGWALIALGVGVGFLFAVLVLAISVVSFPLLLDRDVSLVTAVWTSTRAAIANPIPMAMWGLIVAAGLVLGTLPAFLGLVVVVPVLGHATWHLYRKMVI